MKPIAAGVDSRDGVMMNEDVAKIAEVSPKYVKTELISRYLLPDPVSPHIGLERAGISVDFGQIMMAFERLKTATETVLVEGTGGWLTPLDGGRTMADLAARLQLPVLLVVGVRLGCLNHALLTAQAVRRSGLPWVGWIGSVVEPSMLALQENIDYLTARLPVPMLGLLPHCADAAGDAAHLLPATRILWPSPVAST